jgi:hypothetical protein
MILFPRSLRLLKSLQMPTAMALADTGKSNQAVQFPTHESLLKAHEWLNLDTPARNWL